MTHETDKPHGAPDDPLDAEYRELMKLAGPAAASVVLIFGAMAQS